MRSQTKALDSELQHLFLFSILVFITKLTVNICHILFILPNYLPFIPLKYCKSHKFAVIIPTIANSEGRFLKLDFSADILRKTIEGYLDSVPSLKFNIIQIKLIMHAFHSARYLQSKLLFDLSHATIIKVQYMSKWCNPLY